jgi:hypothetical protein
MSDYLGQLVARTLNRAPMIQPRRPGLFEPPTAAGEWEPAADLSRAQAPSVFQEFESRIPARSSQPLLSPTTDLNPAFRWTPPPVALTVPPLNSIEAGAPHQTEPDLSQPPTLDQLSLRPLQPSPVVRQPLSSAAPESDIRPALKSELSARDDSLRPSSIRQATSPEMREPLAPIVAPSQLTSAQQVEPEEFSRAKTAGQLASTSTPMPIIVRPQVTSARHVEPTEMTAAEPAATIAPPPTIQVTIGRVEVRAVLTTPPPTRPASQPAPTPRLSLDDYLRSRPGGAG